MKLYSIALLLIVPGLYGMDMIKVTWVLPEKTEELVVKGAGDFMMLGHDVTADGGTLYVSDGLVSQLGVQQPDALKSFLVAAAHARDQAEDKKYSWRLRLGSSGARGSLKTIGLTAVGGTVGLVLLDPAYLESLGLCIVGIIGAQTLAVLISAGFYVNGRRGASACERKAIDNVCADYTADKAGTVLEQFNTIYNDDSWQHDVVRKVLQKKSEGLLKETTPLLSVNSQS